MTVRNVPIACPHDPSIKLPLAAGAFTSLCEAIHLFNTQWWQDPATGQPKARNMGEMLMLVVSEIAEAMEGDRKSLMDDKLPAHEMLDVELIDAAIRIMDILGARYKQRQVDYIKSCEGLPSFNPVTSAVPTPGDILYDKCHYNAQRADHKPAARLGPNGKQY